MKKDAELGDGYWTEQDQDIPALGHAPLAAPSHFNATGSKGSSVSEM